MRTTATASLMEALQDKQREAGLKDFDFASQLGLSRQSWVNLRGGKAEPSIETLRRMARLYENLKPLIWDFVMNQSAN